MREWYGALVQQADTAGRGHRAATSSYRVLRAILNTAVQDEILLRNPCALRGASTDRRNERPMVDEHHVWALADAVPDFYRAVVWLAAGTALRTAELAGLRRTDVDLPNRTLTVRQTYVEPARGKPYFGPPKSDAGSRTVVLPSVVVPILQEHLDRYSQPGGAGLIFVSEKGQPLSRHNRKWWRLACKDAGLPTGTRLHDPPAHRAHDRRPVRRHPQRADGTRRALIATRRLDLPTRRQRPRRRRRGRGLGAAEQTPTVGERSSRPTSLTRSVDGRTDRVNLRCRPRWPRGQDR